METHIHCQCDNCSGVDCGADDPDKKEEEEKQLERMKRNSILDEVVDAMNEGVEDVPYWVEQIIDDLRKKP